MQSGLFRRIFAVLLCALLITSLSVIALGENANEEPEKTAVEWEIGSYSISRYARNITEKLTEKSGSYALYTGDQVKLAISCADGYLFTKGDPSISISIIDEAGEDISGGWSVSANEEAGESIFVSEKKIPADNSEKSYKLVVRDGTGTEKLNCEFKAQKPSWFRVEWEKFCADFDLNFIQGKRWKYLVDGLGITLLITLMSGLIGTALGAVIAAVRSTYDMTRINARNTIGRKIFGLIDAFCRLYLTVIRGTPVVIQLMIIYFVIFATSSNGVMIAALAFGLNSGAYVAEIIRGGIMSIDYGQFEAGRSLGFNYLQTMWLIVLPQTIKAVLPSLANELIALLKETSVAGYVALQDLTKAGDIIRSRTYSPFLPLIAVALIYLVLVIFFTRLVGILERSLRKSEH